MHVSTRHLARVAAAVIPPLVMIALLLIGVAGAVHAAWRDIAAAVQDMDREPTT